MRHVPRIHTLAGVRRTALNQYDAVVRPMEKWLAEQGVVFEYGTKVIDVDFIEQADGRRIEALHCTRDGKSFTYALGRDDYAFITIGSMTADSRVGDDEHAPELVRDKLDGAWTLWENMARKTRGLGRPYAFSGNVDESKRESFMHHLGFEDILDEVRRTTTVMPVMMPYITSEFQRRDIADRPPVIPEGARNFALLGQYVEIPEDVVFTVEYSVRGAMHGVYGLLGLKNEIPPIYHGIADPGWQWPACAH
jgi:Myosin-crossreactive antigen